MTVQQTIIKGIKELLFFHNYLVLPDFGGFVLKTGAAHYSPSGVSLLPPSKTLGFNAQLKQNDNVLSIWLQNQLQCSSHEALQHLKDFSEYCSAILGTRRRLNLDGIGFFYLDFENNISFEPQSDANFLIDSFGLAPLQLKEIAVELPVQKNTTVFVDRKVSEPEEKQIPAKARRNYQRMLMPLVLLSLLFSLLVLFVSNNKISGELRASLFGAESKGSYQPLTYPELHLLEPGKNSNAYVADANGIATISLNEKVIAVKAIESNMVNSSKATGSFSRRSHSLHRFEIVLGCFTVLKNAEKMAAKISRQNPNASVSDKNDKGMYVVSSGSFLTKEEAVAGLSAIKDTYPKAWIKQP